MKNDTIILDRKTGKPVIYRDKTLSVYPSTSFFEAVDKWTTPHPYMITTYHITNNPHHMYLGKEQIEQMETDIHHSLCGFGRTASGKYEKKGQTACTLLYEEHESILIVKVSPDYVKTADGQSEEKKELRAYLQSIKDLMKKDGFVGVAMVEGEKK
jgi:hypothetical protein